MEVDVDIHGVVDARAADRNPGVRHGGGCVQWEISQPYKSCNFSTGGGPAQQFSSAALGARRIFRLKAEATRFCARHQAASAFRRKVSA